MVQTDFLRLPTLGWRYQQLNVDEKLGRMIHGFDYGKVEEGNSGLAPKTTQDEFRTFINFVCARCPTEKMLMKTFDADKNGKVSFYEFWNALRKIAYPDSIRVAKPIFEAIDIARSGNIEIRDLIDICSGKLKIFDEAVICLMTAKGLHLWCKAAKDEEQRKAKARAGEEERRYKPIDRPPHQKAKMLHNQEMKVVANTSQHLFFQETASEKMYLPRVPRWLYDDGIRTLDIADKDELTFAPEFQALAHSVKWRLLESISFARCHIPESLFANAIPGLKNLTHLALIDCHLGLGIITALEDLSIATTSIDFSFSRIAKNFAEDWHALFASFNSLSLTQLCLHGTMLGRGHRGQEALQSAELQSLVTRLACLDLSNNYLLEEGYGYLSDILAHSQCMLAELDVSYMASCFHTEDNLCFLERLRENKSLHRLSMRGMQCGFYHDVILEDSLGNSGSSSLLRELDVSDNPHGIYGLRALFRLLCRPQCKVTRLTLGDIRDAPTPAHASFSYQGGANEGPIILDLAKPHHRALHHLYHTLPRIAFTDTLVNGKPGALPADGVVGVVSFSLRHIEDDDIARTSAEALMRAPSALRLKVSFRRFAMMCDTFHQMRTANDILMFVYAMSADLELKLCQIKFLMKHVPPYLDPRRMKLVPKVCRYLLSSVHGTTYVGWCNMLSAVRGASRIQIIRECAAFLWFAPENPTGHYHLNLVNPIDLEVSGRLMVLDKWHSKVAATREQLPDLSQFGNGCCIRNIKYIHEPVRDMQDIPFLARVGDLVFDFSSPLRLVGQQLSNTDYIKYVCNVLKDTTCSLPGIERAMRHLSSHLVVSDETLKDIIEVLPVNAPTTSSKRPSARSNPNIDLQQLTEDESVAPATTLGNEDGAQALSKPGTANGKRAEDSKPGTANSKPTLSKPNTAHSLDSMASLSTIVSMQGECNLRVEAFICLFNRCLDNPRLTSSSVLYNKNIFQEREMREIRYRLGKLHIFDALNCHRGDTNNGNGFGRGNRRTLCLSLWEDYRLFSFLQKLKLQEKGEFLKIQYADGTEGDIQKEFEVPSTWDKDIPQEGTITFTYSCATPNSSIRWELAKTFLGWVHDGEKSAA
eukprot:GEMP01002883.1.p1 GENE.GEMP01002883.1~~GEMP01002883.1.p1  ORF type:complete len:1208 (+),score=217.73 GEMP01002883.1:331-3624(+)